MDDGLLANLGINPSGGSKKMAKSYGIGKQPTGNNKGMQTIAALSMDTKKLKAADPAGIMAKGSQSAVKPVKSKGKKLIRGKRAR